MHDYTVTFATYNCLDYTIKCLKSLIDSGVQKNKIVVVDNNSTDSTVSYLRNLEIGSLIINRQNLSCGTAWNQGILANQSEWTIVMNNDVVVSNDFVTKLIDFAILNNLKLVSPARIDGELNYDFDEFSTFAQNKTYQALRIGSSNAICMCIHWSLFNQIGFFRAAPNLLGFEDGIFFNEIRKNNIKHATTGSVWIHHFDGVTQKYLKKSFNIPVENNLIKVNDRKLYGQSWIERKIYRFNLKKLQHFWKKDELFKYDMTLHGVRYENKFLWL